MSFVNARILNSPVSELKLIIDELDWGIAREESYKLYERTQSEGNDVFGENWEIINIFRGVANDVT